MKYLETLINIQAAIEAEIEVEIEIVTMMTEAIRKEFM